MLQTCTRWCLDGDTYHVKICGPRCSGKTSVVRYMMNRDEQSKTEAPKVTQGILQENFQHRNMISHGAHFSQYKHRHIPRCLRTTRETHQRPSASLSQSTLNFSGMEISLVRVGKASLLLYDSDNHEEDDYVSRFS